MKTNDSTALENGNDRQNSNTEGGALDESTDALQHLAGADTSPSAAPPDNPKGPQLKV
jgi:hypothetical protein